MTSTSSSEGHNDSTVILDDSSLYHMGLLLKKDSPQTSTKKNVILKQANLATWRGQGYFSTQKQNVKSNEKMIQSTNQTHLSVETYGIVKRGSCKGGGTPIFPIVS